MKTLLFVLALSGCALAPESKPSGNVRASCPEPLAVEASVKEWYAICRDAALIEHVTLSRSREAKLPR